jgi:hypothetical protein
MRMQALLKQLIKRELKFRQEHIVGTVLNDLKILQFDQSGTGAPVWVASIDIGSNRVLQDVIVLAGVDGTRRYAKVGRSVILRQNTMGRYDVVGPADRIGSLANVKTYTVGVAAPVTTGGTGFQYFRVPFIWYANLPNPPNAGRWNDGVSPFPFTQIQDADGNPI